MPEDSADAALATAADLRDAGDLDAAEEAIRRAFDADPERADAHYQHALLAQERGRHDEARARFERALDRDSEYVDAHLALAGPKTPVVDKTTTAVAPNSSSRCIRTVQETPSATTDERSTSTPRTPTPATSTPSS